MMKFTDLLKDLYILQLEIIQKYVKAKDFELNNPEGWPINAETVDILLKVLEGRETGCEFGKDMTKAQVQEIFGNKAKKILVHAPVHDRCLSHCAYENPFSNKSIC